MRVLIVKTSSMGDSIHALPALTDATKVIPNIEFDWVIEEAFSEIPRLHKSVKEVIPIALRRWRKNPLRAIAGGEIKQFWQHIRAKQYDLVIDAQASLKSAVVTRFTKGLRCGMNGNSVREPFANWFYQKTFLVERKQHAIRRQRQLFAQALNYSFIDDQPDYAIDRNKLISVPIDLPKQYVVFVHNTSWQTKVWPENYWSFLMNNVAETGLHVVLPWGTQEEKQRAERLAALSKHAQVLPKLSLAQMATVLANAKAAVCSDTGLSHLAAALNIPAVVLYGPTNPDLIGTVGKSQIHLRADFPCAPCKKMKCSYKKPSAEKPACFTTIPPEQVWNEFKRFIPPSSIQQPES